MRTRIFAIFSWVVSGLCCFAQNNFESELQKVLNQPEFKNTTVGIQITDFESENTLFELNAHKLMIPASTLKIITSATALEILGSDYRFRTKIGYTGELLKTNELIGDLVVLGGGDPTLGSEYFNQKPNSREFISIWAQKIKAAGIQKINGDLILDGSIYDSEKIPPTWIWGDIGNYYGTGVSAFTCYDNLFRITFKSQKEAGIRTEIVSLFPNIEGLDIVNEVISSDDNRDMAYVFGSPLDKSRVIRGTIPKNRNSFTIKAAVHQPEELLAEALLNRLATEGVFITGKIKYNIVDEKKLKTFYIHESPELKEIVKVLNHESVNLIAEHLVMQIAAEKNGTGNRESGIEIIREFWKSNGTGSEIFFMEDGSGLSHFNAVSPATMNSILIFMAGNVKNRDVFMNSLPSAGKGTLTSFNTSFFPQNTLLAKSGSMTRVRCYAGYLQTESGKNLAFTFMFNHFSSTHATLIKSVENLLVKIRKTM